MKQYKIIMDDDLKVIKKKKKEYSFDPIDIKDYKKTADLRHKLNNKNKVKEQDIQINENKRD